MLLAYSNNSRNTTKIMAVMVRCNLWDCTRVELKGHGVVTFISIPNFLSPQPPKFNVHTRIISKNECQQLRFLAKIFCD